MVSFESDYNNGMHPDILRRLIDTNDEQTTGYGFDPYCEQAKEKIRSACQMGTAEIYFLIGGTQTNTTMIDALLAPGEGVIAATSTCMRPAPWRLLATRCSHCPHPTPN